MRKTQNLQLPIYDNPSQDAFNLTDWNTANTNLEAKYVELRNDYIAESGRIANENTRSSNENTRIANETARVQSFTSMQQTNEAFRSNLDGRFNTLQGNVNTTVSNKITEIEQEVADELAVLNQTNEAFKSDVETTVNTFDGRVSTLEDEADFPITNMIPNADFSDGISGWSLVGLSGTAISEGVKLTSNATNAQPSITRRIVGKKRTGQKIYSRCVFKIVTNNISAFRFQLGTSIISQHSPIVNEIYSLSSVQVLNNDNVDLYSFCNVSFVGSTALANEEFIVSSLIGIDLTEVFGAGNEPTKEQMDALLSFYPNSFFDGTVNLSDNRRFVPYLMNELGKKADKVQEGWVTPTLQNGATGTVKYRKTQWGRVELKGSITFATQVYASAVLPVGYRPSSDISCSVVTTDQVIGSIVIFTDGALYCSNNALLGKTVNFNNISFIL